MFKYLRELRSLISPEKEGSKGNYVPFIVGCIYQNIAY